jgi:fibrillarin-like pre-rRNA processing protein
MRSGREFRPYPGASRLLETIHDGREELWTETVGDPPPVYGERWTEVDRRPLRQFDPTRSKLAAAVLRGWSGDLPAPGELWLYLGAATGTTASHVADLVGPDGRVYAVERSLRPFGKLLALSGRWPNLRPVLADARAPEEYAALVPPVDGVYADVAQPDQLEIFRRNVELLHRRDGCRLLLALKTASMGRERSSTAHLAEAQRDLSELATLAASVALEPFHRGHFMVGGRWGRDQRLPSAVPGRPSRPRGRRRERRAR